MEWNSPVTVFFANIAASLPDSFILKILNQFGNVIRWKRATGVKGEPYDFGFADYESPNDALKALRLAPEVKILDCIWIAKVDNRVQDDLDAYVDTLSLRNDYDPKKIEKNDQLTIHMINALISTTPFARVVPKRQQILISERDDDRKSEHFRYLKLVQREEEELEKRYRYHLTEWRQTEIAQARQLDDLRNMNKVSDEDKKRVDFLAKWRFPDVKSLEDLQNARQKYMMYLKCIQELKNKRQIEKSDL